MIEACIFNQVWESHMSIISAFRNLRQEDSRFEATLAYVKRHCRWDGREGLHIFKKISSQRSSPWTRHRKWQRCYSVCPTNSSLTTMGTWSRQPGRGPEAIRQGLIWTSHVEQVLCCQLSLKKPVLDASSITWANLKPWVLSPIAESAVHYKQEFPIRTSDMSYHTSYCQLRIVFPYSLFCQHRTAKKVTMKRNYFWF